MGALVDVPDVLRAQDGDGRAGDNLTTSITIGRG
jgi:hypothetical protein